MNARRARRLLLAAFLISLLLHGILALSVRWRVTPPRELPQKITVAHREVIHITARVPPSAPPSAPPVTPRPAAVAHSVVPPSVISHGPGVRAPSPPIAAATAAPVHTAAPPGCVKTDEPAAVAVEPPPAEIPLDARGRGVSGTTIVNVKLDERGAVTEIALGVSSGDPALDQVAIAMAKFAQYTPASHLCKALASTYAFKVRFAAW